MKGSKEFMIAPPATCIASFFGTFFISFPSITPRSPWCFWHFFMDAYWQSCATVMKCGSTTAILWLKCASPPVSANISYNEFAVPFDFC